MDEEISVEKPQNYNELINIIKNEFLLGDDELEGTILIFEDQINGGKSKLIPQVFNQFIEQNNPTLFIEVQENSKIYNEALNMSGDLEDNKNQIVNKENKEEDKKQFNKYEEIIIDQNMLNEIKAEKNNNITDFGEEPSKEMVISRILEKAKIQKEMKKKKEIEQEKNNNIITNDGTQNVNEIKQLEKLTQIAQKEENTFINSMNKTKENKTNKKENKKENKKIKKEKKNENKKDKTKDKTKDNKIQDPLDNKFKELSEELIKDTIMSTSRITNSNISTTIHKDIQCNGCGMESIYGIRYKCTICPNFNFCSICENIKEHEHPFLKIKFPIDK